MTRTSSRDRPAEIRYLMRTRGLRAHPPTSPGASPKAWCKACPTPERPTPKKAAGRGPAIAGQATTASTPWMDDQLLMGSILQQSARVHRTLAAAPLPSMPPWAFSHHQTPCFASSSHHTPCTGLKWTSLLQKPDKSQSTDGACQQKAHVGGAIQPGIWHQPNLCTKCTNDAPPQT